MDIYHLIDQAVPVLTPNRRLARRLQQEVAERRLAAGATAWETPRVLSWQAWLRRTWDDPALGERPALLSSTQAAMLWDAVVAGDRVRLLLPAGAAAGAAEAWTLLHAWRLDLDAGEFGQDGDGRAFRRWARAYRSRCERGDWLDEARLPDALATHLAEGRLVPPDRLVCYAFDEPTPQQQALFDALEAAGCRVVQMAPTPCAGEVRRTVLPTFADELHAAASWARAALEVDPDQRIGIVVPDLVAARTHVERTLTAVLDPARLLVDERGAHQPYALSLGRPLADWPAVDTALRLLGMLQPGALPFNEISQLLRSPHLAGGHDEADGRARAELALREVGRHEWRLDAVLGATSGHAPRFARCVTAAREALGPGGEGAGQRHSPGAWSTRFGAALEAAGWPGDTALDSAGYQAVSAFHELLAEVARLDAVGGQLPLGLLLAHLVRLARERLFQPAGDAARVEVLGLLEASGQRFERLWVCGLDETAWPPPAHPNPFIPARLRRAHGLPHASVERESAVAQRLTRGFATSADVVIFSHAAREDDAELAPSPLILPYDPIARDALVPLLAPRPSDLVGTAELEACVDGVAPPLPGGRLRGGSARVADQSACPFRAFARHRLAAEPLAPPPRGLDAMTRGRLVHAVLQALWRDEGPGVAQLAPERRRARVTLASARAINGVGTQLGDRPRLRAIEQRRLVDLVEAWLDVDAGLPAERRSEVEKDVEHRIGDHLLRLRLDRLDTLPDGRVVIVDYKTAARLRPADWDAPRPAAPQLPLYAAALDPERVAALAFAKIHVEGCGYVGLAADDGALPGVAATSDATQRIRAAAEAAESLLREHVSGRAEVDPQPRACTYCGLEPLCRVNELEGLVEEDDGDG